MTSNHNGFDLVRGKMIVVGVANISKANNKACCNELFGGERGGHDAIVWQV